MLRFCLLFCGVLPACSPEYGSVVDYLPQTPSASESVDCFSLCDASAEERLSVLSLQGLVNREQGKIYTYGDADRWILDLYMDEGYITDTVAYKNNFDLLAKYKSSFDGAVVYDPGKPYTVILATNIAGVEDLVMVSPDMVATFKEVTGKERIVDIREMGFENQSQAFSWYRENIYPKQNHDVLVLGQGLSPAQDINRDYAVEFRLPSFWLPGPNDDDYEKEYEDLLMDFLDQSPVNIPVLGFWPGYDQNGKRIGYDELPGVRLAGYYGKFTLVSDIVGNYSYHSGVRPERPEYEQVKPRQKEYGKYDPTKKYVALIMNESGDAPCYFMYQGFFPRQWNDPERGKVAISYGISPSLRFLMPGILSNVYRTQTENDYFFCSISGAGYCYPFMGYGSETADYETAMTDYFALTAQNMKIMDLDMLGLYTHPDIGWTDDDRELAEKYILPMDGLRSVISGMHRTEYTAGNAHELYGDVSVHHTVTFWSTENFVWDDRSLDEVAVDHLEKEIKTYGADGDFIQAMFYSWHYGPRRLNMLRERLESEGYEFVTLDEFDRLWRDSRK